MNKLLVDRHLFAVCLHWVDFMEAEPGSSAESRADRLINLEHATLADMCLDKLPKYWGWPESRIARYCGK
jgi:hypothetical protein